MKWLFVTTKFPWPIIHGRWLRVYHLTRTLSKIGETVSILSHVTTEEGHSAYSKVGINVISYINRPHLKNGPGRCFLAPCTFDYNFGEAIKKFASNFDIIVLEGTRMMQYAFEARSSKITVLDMVDDPLLEYKRRKTFETRKFLQLIKKWKNHFGQILLERFSLPHIDYTIFVSEEDCINFNRRHPKAKTIFVPNGVDITFFSPKKPPTSHSNNDNPTIVFIGHMSNPNNQNAVFFLVKKIAPLIWKNIPKAKIIVVGADPPNSVKRLASENVTITGYVEDIRPYLWNAKIVLLPMKSGTGIKNKLLEAWAAEAPVVATPLACQGTPAKPRENILLGDSPEELATACLELLHNSRLRMKIANQGRKTVEAQLTWEHSAKKLRAKIVYESKSWA